MLRTYTTLLFLGIFGVIQAQFVNSGGTVTIQQGAKLFVEGSITNETAGSISNDGTIEVTGDFTNTATVTSLADSKIIFSGANDSNLDAGGATFAEVIVNKDAGKQVTLLSDAAINESIDFMADDNLVTLGNHNLTLSATAVATGYDDNEYVNTNGTGELIKQAMSSFEYPVGNGSYTPVSLTEAGTADDKGVRVLANPLDAGTTGTAITSDMVDAAWVVSESTAGGSDLTVTPQWNASDNLTGLSLTDLGVARYNGSSYDMSIADLGAATGTDPYTATRSGFADIGAFVVGGDPALRYVAVSPKVFLAGPYNGTDMNDQLRAGGLIPTAEPYTAMTSFTHVGRGGNESVTAIADFDGTTTAENVVDWVFLELRDKTDNTNVLATRSALLQKNGDIVDIDRGAVKFAGVSADDYYVVVRHRNHLGIMSNAVAALSTTVASMDFTTSLSSAHDAGHINDAMMNISGTYCLWAGDVDNNGRVRYLPLGVPLVPADALIILSVGLGGVPNGSLLNNYNSFDVNMDGIARYLPQAVPLIPSDVLFILSNTLGGIPNGDIKSHL